MKKSTNFIKSYKYVLIFIIIIVLMCIIQPSEGYAAMVITKKNLLEMVYVIPPIFILLGLLDVWDPKETMMKYMGKNSRVKGIGLAFMLGMTTNDIETYMKELYDMDISDSKSQLLIIVTR